MKILEKTTIVSTLIILLLTLAAFMPNINAADAQTVNWDTFAYIIVSPNPVGVGQDLIVQFRIDKTVPTGSVLGPFWEGFTVKITRPDGTTETRGPLTADSTGGSWFIYTPTIVGQYTFQTSFPGQLVTWSGGVPPGGFLPLPAFQRYYKPSHFAV